MLGLPFREKTSSRPGFVTKGPPLVNKALVSGPDEEVLDQTHEKETAKVQPYGTGTARWTSYYKESESAKGMVRSTPPPRVFGTIRSEPKEWYTEADKEIQARRVLRGYVAERETMDGLSAVFRSSPGPAILPTGQAAQTQFSDFSRISAAMQRNDFATLVRPENILAISRGVRFGVSTPLFSAFVAYMNLPAAGLLPPQLSSRAIFIDLVKRAVLQNNQGRAWSDFVGTEPSAVPVAMPVPADSKTGGAFFGG
jgi:hypothetical protein